MRPSRLRRPGASPGDWSSTTHLSLSMGRELAESCPELAEGMEEIEFSVLARACLRGRNGDDNSLERGVSACVPEWNETGATINWRFTAQDARRKLSRLNPCHS